MKDFLFFGDYGIQRTTTKQTHASSIKLVSNILSIKREIRLEWNNYFSDVLIFLKKRNER